MTTGYVFENRTNLSGVCPSRPRLSIFTWSHLHPLSLSHMGKLAATGGLAVTMERGRCPKTVVLPLQYPDQRHQVTWKLVKNANSSGGQAICFDKPPGNFDAGSSGRVPSARRDSEGENSKEQGRATRHLPILTCSEEENLNFLFLKPHFLQPLIFYPNTSVFRGKLNPFLLFPIMRAESKEGLQSGDDLSLHREVTSELILVELKGAVDYVTLPC